MPGSEFCWYHEPGAGRKFGSGYVPTRATASEPWRSDDPVAASIVRHMADDFIHHVSYVVVGPKAWRGGCSTCGASTTSEVEFLSDTVQEQEQEINARLHPMRREG